MPKDHQGRFSAARRQNSNRFHEREYAAQPPPATGGDTGIADFVKNFTNSPCRKFLDSLTIFFPPTARRAMLIDCLIGRGDRLECLLQ
jgi:hypothetical protein